MLIAYWISLKYYVQNLEFWWVTGTFPICDDLPANVFLDSQGQPDNQTLVRYHAALLDTAMAEKPDIPNLVRAFSSLPKNTTQFFNVVVQDLPKTASMRHKAEASILWTRYLYAKSNLWYYLAPLFCQIGFIFSLPVLGPFVKILMKLAAILSRPLLFLLLNYLRLAGEYMPFWNVLVRVNQVTSDEVLYDVYGNSTRPVLNFTTDFLEHLENRTRAWNAWDLPDGQCAQLNSGMLFDVIMTTVIIGPLIEEIIKVILSKLARAYWRDDKAIQAAGDCIGGIYFGVVEGLLAWMAYMDPIVTAATQARRPLPIYPLFWSGWYVLKHAFAHSYLGALPYLSRYFLHAFWNFCALLGVYQNQIWWLGERSPCYEIYGEMKCPSGWDFTTTACAEDFYPYMTQNRYHKFYDWWYRKDDDLLFMPIIILIPVLLLLSLFWLVQRRRNTTQQKEQKTLTFKEYFSCPNPSSGITIAPLCIGEIPNTVAPWNSVKFADGSHRRGKPSGYYSLGLNLSSAVPYCFAGCHHNCNGAGVLRMAGVPKRYAVLDEREKVTDLWNDHIIPFALEYINRPMMVTVDRGVIREITKEEWLKRFTVAQAAALEKEYRLGTRRLDFDMFVKKEKSVMIHPKYALAAGIDFSGVDVYQDGGYQILLAKGGNKFDPRGISVPHSDTRVEMGPSSNRLQNFLKMRFSDNVLFASGMTRREFSKWYSDRIHIPGDHYANVGDDLLHIHVTEWEAWIESMDASRFDQHVLPVVLRMNALIYRELGWTLEFTYSMKTIDKRYKIRPGLHGSKGVIKVKGTQASGKWDTLGGNSLPMMILAAYSIEKNVDIKTLLYDAGFVCEGPRTSIENLGADFLQNLPYLTRDDGIRFGPKIGRILARTFWHDKELSENKRLPFCLGIMVGMANDIMHIPILNDLFRRLQELVEKPWFCKKKQHYALEHSDTPAIENPNTVDELCQRYQVSRPAFNSYRHYIRKWQPGHMLDFGHEELVARIVAVDCLI